MNKRKLNRLKDPSFRHEYVLAHVDQGLAYQIRTLRESRGWDQKQLARKLGLRSQSAVARMEDPSYGKLSLATIKKLAKVFDVGVLVKYVPFSRLLLEVESISAENLAATSFEEELPSLEKSIRVLTALGIYSSYENWTIATPVNPSNYSAPIIAKSPSHGNMIEEVIHG